MMLSPPVSVALARRVPALPWGPGWSFEPKLDGHRQVLFATAEGVLLQTRAGRLVQDHYPDLVAAAEQQVPPGTVLDGEAIIFRAGRTDFSAIQQRASSSPARCARLARELPASFVAFDVLCAHDTDLRGRPYCERRNTLVSLLTLARPPIQVIPATGDADAAAAMLHDLTAAGVEGVVCKRTEGRYLGGQRNWLKVKHDLPRPKARVHRARPS
jgi:ATP-dependent DNA ligase